MSHIHKVTVKKAVYELPLEEVQGTSCQECEITAMFLELMDKKQPSMS
ncbi:MAG TPA: hypothetical protein PKY35_08475 [Candidatus Hydrogenedentes bacterium]|nr:hypothetical protein [Candidatus Hydrogenedentota bacterium]HOL77050.1 hypothetical protein [Candidatus Hydrogenedentota bacterium]HPO85767.1 hypothetical protein [Candidatus Hydrogenedentota bacterium]